MATESIMMIDRLTPLVREQLVMECLGKVKGIETIGQCQAVVIGVKSGVIYHGTENQCVDYISGFDRSKYSYNNHCRMPNHFKTTLQLLFRNTTFRPHPPTIIKQGGNSEVVNLLVALTGKANYGDAKNSQAWRFEQSSDYVRYGTTAEFDRLVTGHGYTLIDADSPADLNRLRESLGFKPIMLTKPEPVTDLSRCISPGLFTFITGNYQDEMVMGFLLKENEMRLPVEVHKLGLEAITKWILEQYNARQNEQWEKYQAGLVKSPEVEVKKTGGDVVVRYRKFQDVSGKKYYARTDRMEMEITVPADVIARQSENSEAISDWIYENDGAARQIGDTHHGDEDDGDYVDGTESNDDSWHENYVRSDGIEIE